MPTILTYHHISSPPATGDNPGLFVSPESFEQQLQTLADQRIPVLSLDALRSALEDEAGQPVARKAAVITFDDGYENNRTNALPLLKKFGFTATFFITTGWIGESSPQGHRMMNADQIRELAAEGMTIGAHTVSHPWLAKLSYIDARRELEDSKAALESIVGEPVRWLCYPSGSFNFEIENIAKELGFVGACSVIRDNRMHLGQLHHLPRVMVMHDTSLRRFRYYFSPLYHLVHARKNRKRWAQYL